ncbi:hypothetical protein ISCGN_004659 [Ixodes scapularis]
MTREVPKGKPVKVQCWGEVSVRNGSFFKGSQLALPQLMKIIYLWCQNLPCSVIQREADLARMPLPWILKSKKTDLVLANCIHIHRHDVFRTKASQPLNASHSFFLQNINHPRTATNQLPHVWTCKQYEWATVFTIWLKTSIICTSQEGTARRKPGWRLQTSQRHIKQGATN